MEIEAKKAEKYMSKIHHKLKYIINKEIEKENYETALEAIAACAELFYQWNQTYVDEELESAIFKIQTKLLKQPFSIREVNKNVVLFYDFCGWDTRGLVLIYLKNLLELGYHVVYVTGEHAKGRQPELNRVVKGKNITFEYYPIYDKFLSQIHNLDLLFRKYKPSYAFINTVPYDVASTLIFNNYASVVERFLINLTDHAFWIGKNAFDYCLEFRDYGAIISKEYRNIESSRIIKLPYYPYYNREMEFEGFPFDANGKKIIFSGGALYKTFGEENIYYKIVENILNYGTDTIFLYAGFGDDSELLRLAQKYPDRVYHIAERKDLFQVMEHIYFYLNTYPILGGLMTQYAVTAGKIPVTLMHDNDSDGILLNQEELGIFYESYDNLMEDVYRLLDEPEYLAEKEKIISRALISEEEFKNELGRAMSEHRTKYTILYDYIDTSNFRKEYILRFNKETYETTYAQKGRWCLGKYFPIYILRGYFRKLFKR